MDTTCDTQEQIEITRLLIARARELRKHSEELIRSAVNLCREAEAVARKCASDDVH
jgi:hypothetical protein